MKKLLVALLAVMFVAGSAMAMEFETSGSYYVRGTYINNDSGLSNDPEPKRYWDHDLDMDVKIIVSDQTFVFTEIEIHDENFGQDKGETDDNIEFKKAYGSHTFSTGTQIDFGLMTGEAWATEWNDDSGDFYRVKIMHPFGDHKLYVLTQKEEENSVADVKDGNADDNDTYFIGLDAKLGDISVRPGLAYRVIGNDSKGAVDQEQDATVIELTLGAEGEMGSLGFEGELAYESKNWDVTGEEDFSLFGAYFKGWMDLGTGKVGGLLAYGSYDKDSGEGFGFGEDFCPTGLGANWYPIGNYDPANITEPNDTRGLWEYNAVTLLWLFGEFEASEALSFDGGFAYWMSNSEDNAWEDANGYELNAGMSYKITDAVTYSAAAQWGQINLDDDNSGIDDPDPATRVWHRLKITF